MNAVGPESGRLLLNPRQAAKSLSISPRKLWSLTDAGDIQCVRIGRLVRYPIDALEAYIDARRQGGRS